MESGGGIGLEYKIDHLSVVTGSKAERTGIDTGKRVGGRYGCGLLVASIFSGG